MALIPQVCLGFSYEAPTVTQRSQWLNSDSFDAAMKNLGKPRIVTMNVSAYTAHEGGSVGAWDNELSIGDCASDDLPRGTKVVVNGRVYTVNDVFGANYTNRLDIYYGWDLESAMNFGRKNILVEILIDQ